MSTPRFSAISFVCPSWSRSLGLSNESLSFVMNVLPAPPFTLNSMLQLPSVMSMLHEPPFPTSTSGQFAPLSLLYQNFFFPSAVSAAIPSSSSIFPVSLLLYLSHTRPLSPAAIELMSSSEFSVTFGLSLS